VGLLNRNETLGALGEKCAGNSCDNTSTTLIVQAGEWDMLFSPPVDSAWFCDDHALNIIQVGGVKATLDELEKWRRL
jgi:hypothetical protein